MKLFFAILLLANIAVGMWGAWYAAPAPPPPPPEQARPGVAPDRLRLLSEPGVALKPRGVQPPVPDTGGAPGCFRLGPFADAAAAAQVSERLSALGVGVSQRTIPAVSATAYRVVIGPFPTRDAADAQRKALSRAGLRDHALIGEETPLAISAGVFSVEGNAHKRLRELADKGFTGRVETVSNIRTLHWLDLRGNPAAIVNEDWMDADVALHTELCPAANP